MGVILVCDCGKRLKAPGAVPGRVGRCPACGGTLRVPDAVVEPPPPPPDDAGGGYGLADAPPPPPPPSFAAPPRAPIGPARRRTADPDVAEDRGLVRPPRSPEATVGGSLLYPLWGLHGIVLLVALPPVLWLTSIFSVGLIPGFVLGQGAMALGALTMVLPMGMVLALTLGYAARFLEGVVIESAAGEAHHPRLPSWAAGGFVGSVVRLLACAAIGFAGPGFLAVLYWLNCGDLDWADRAILATILTPGAVYAQIALAAVVLHDDLAAANPVTVLAALARVGSPAFAVLLPTTVATALTALAAALLFTLDGGLAAIAAYLFWVAALYEGMVTARVLGNFCRRHRRDLGWFRDR